MGLKLIKKGKTYATTEEFTDYPIINEGPKAPIGIVVVFGKHLQLWFGS